MRFVLILIALLSLASTAQAVTVNGSTWTDPAEITVEYDKFQRDADGKFIKDSNNTYVREPQTFTLHWDLELTCDLTTASPGIGFVISPRDFNGVGITENGESRSLLRLSPNEFNATWERSGATGPWHSTGQEAVSIVNEQAWPFEKDHVTEYNWFANVEVRNGECFGNGFQGSLDFQNQTITVPALSGLEPFVPDQGPSTRGVPAPAVPLALALVGLAALKKR